MELEFVLAQKQDLDNVIQLASAYVINQQCEEVYAKGEWKYPNPSYYVIHRLCVDPIYQGKGIGRNVMLHIENEIRKMGIDTIRLDAFTSNPYAVKLYEKLGYLKVGVVHWRKVNSILWRKKYNI